MKEKNICISFSNNQLVPDGTCVPPGTAQLLQLGIRVDLPAESPVPRRFSHCSCVLITATTKNSALQRQGASKGVRRALILNCDLLELEGCGGPQTRAEGGHHSRCSALGDRVPTRNSPFLSRYLGNLPASAPPTAYLLGALYSPGLHPTPSQSGVLGSRWYLRTDAASNPHC